MIERSGIFDPNASGHLPALDRFSGLSPFLA
jgi:hypothetical protein